jgi:hypothetical protein
VRKIKDLVQTEDHEVGGSNPPSCTSVVFTEETTSDLTRIRALIFASGKHREVLSACFVTLAPLRPFSNPTMRALREHVVGLAGQLVWEPACGTGIMSAPLSEYALAVASSDVHDYGWGHIQHDFLMPFLPDGIGTVEWITTNPPFRLAVEFVERALDVASHGVAILVRSVWTKGCDRYDRLFSKRPPTVIAQFAERGPMTRAVGTRGPPLRRVTSDMFGASRYWRSSS